MAGSKKMEWNKLDVHRKIKIDKSIVNSFRVFDVIQDKSSKSWLVFKINHRKNLLRVLRFPPLDSNNILVDLDLNNTKTQGLIRNVYRKVEE